MVPGVLGAASRRGRSWRGSAARVASTTEIASSSCSPQRAVPRLRPHPARDKRAHWGTRQPRTSRVLAQRAAKDGHGWWTGRRRGLADQLQDRRMVGRRGGDQADRTGSAPDVEPRTLVQRGDPGTAALGDERPDPAAAGPGLWLRSGRGEMATPGLEGHRSLQEATSRQDRTLSTAARTIRSRATCFRTGCRSARH